MDRETARAGVMAAEMALLDAQAALDAARVKVAAAEARLDAAWVLLGERTA
jgi:hypothetical protein